MFSRKLPIAVALLLALLMMVEGLPQLYAGYHTGNYGPQYGLYYPWNNLVHSSWSYPTYNTGSYYNGYAAGYAPSYQHYLASPTAYSTY